MVVAVTLGTLLILVATGARDAFLSPGPLSAVHAQLACSACHASDSRARVDEGEAGCLGCHAFERDANVAQAHFLAGAHLDALTQAARARSRTDTGDLPLAGMMQGARTLRLADGPDEVHRILIAKNVLKQYHAGGSWDFGN